MLKIAHLAIQVRDMDRSLRFYRDVIGMSYVGTSEATDYQRVSLSIGQVNLTLLKRNDVDGSTAPPSAQNAIGLDHLGFVVDDVNALCERLKEAGAEFVTEGPADFFKVRDPDGVLLDIASESRGWR